MIALALLAPVLMLVVLGNEERFCDKFNLMMFLRFLAGRCEFAVALRTGSEFAFDGLVDWVGSEGHAEVLLMSFLSADLFLAPSVFVFGRLDDVRRRRFGRVAGVLFESSDLGIACGDLFESGLKQGFEFSNSAFEFRDPSIFGIHIKSIMFLMALGKRKKNIVNGYLLLYHNLLSVSSIVKRIFGNLSKFYEFLGVAFLFSIRLVHSGSKVSVCNTLSP